jgi:hypothetical protein
MVEPCRPHVRGYGRVRPGRYGPRHGGVFRSVHVTAPALALLGAFLTAGLLAGLVPVPGGHGSFELALGLSLAAAGVPAASFVAGVLGYRLLTSWLPVVPAGIAFGSSCAAAPCDGRRPLSRTASVWDSPSGPWRP